VLADAGAFVWEADAVTLEFTSVSRGVEPVLGIRPDEWPSDPSAWAELIHPDDRRAAVSRLVRAASSGTAFDHEHRLRRADGTFVWVREIGRVVRGPDARPATIVGLTVEVTGSHAAEAERAAHEERFRSVIERIPAIVYHRDAAGQGEPSSLPYVSLQVSGLLGVDPQTWIADPDAWRAAIHPDDLVAFDEAWEAARTGTAAFTLQYRLVGPTGAMLWFRDEGVPMLDEAGRVARWQGVMIDVTTERETHAALMEAEDRYRALVEESPMITYLDAVEGPAATIYISPQTTEILGYTPEEWYADPELWSRIVHPEDAARPAPSAEEGPASSEYRLIAKDGREVWVHDRARLIVDEQGRPRYWQGVLIDVTQHREAERLRRDLERERSEAERLRTEDELKTTFLHAVSHDLRTPLAAILGLAVTLGREDVELTTEETRDLAARIGSSARRLDRIVRDFLDLERLQRGAAEPELDEVDLAEVVTELLEDPNLAGGHTVTLDLRPMRVRADRAMVLRIVENLVGNAAKHTPEAARVWVRLERAEGGAVLIVEDDGPGVPSGAQERIFEPFRQGPGAGPGSGLGLALVSRFAQLHGGRAWVEDRVGGGASFRVFLSADPGSGVEDRGGNPGRVETGQDGSSVAHREGADSSAEANQA
jgi:PAS domain S-box-containing protein